MPKFDVAIMNPPYTRGGKDTRPLYAEIISIILDNKLANEVKAICPTGWTHEQNPGFLKIKFKDKVREYFVSCKEVDGREHFDISMTLDLGIYDFNLNANNKNDIDELKYSRFKNKKLAKSILEKIKIVSNKKNINTINKKDFNKKFYLQAAALRGNKGSWDWTTIFGENQRKEFLTSKEDIRSNKWSFWNFDTEEECKNFVKYTELDIIGFILYAYKNALGQPINEIPDVSDYTREWTEKDIQKELGITDEELDYIHEEMKDFGWKTRNK